MRSRLSGVKRTTVVFVSLALASTMAACGSNSSENNSNDEAPTTGTSKEVEKMTVAVQSAPRSMDIAHAADFPSQRAISAAFDRITALDNDGQVIPWVAESWEQPDPLTYVFTIRDDVTFWDGTPLTTEDVAYSLIRHLDEDLGSEVAGLFPTLKTAVATDESTVTVTLTAATAGFLSRTAIDWTIIQKKYSEAAGKDLGTPTKPGMGTGPYTVADYSATDGVTLERYDDYWGTKPTVKTLVVKAIEDAELARLALLSDEVQGYFDVPLIASRKFDTLENTAMTYVDGSYIDLLSMNVTKAPFDDPKVREAVALLVDREGLNKPLFNDRAKLATSIVPSGQVSALMGADEAATFQESLPTLPSFDVEAAKAALAASGHADGFEVTLNVDRTQPWMLPMAQNMAENGKEIGITITPKEVSAAVWANTLFEEDRSPLQLVALGASSPDISSLPGLILGEGSINVSQFTTPELVAQLKTLGESTDPAETTAVLEPILAASNESLAYMPLYDEQAAFALSKTLVWEGGYSPWALGQVWPIFIKSAE